MEQPIFAFDQGDVVQLKCGSPKMMVKGSSIGGSPDKSLTFCLWITEDGLVHEHNIPTGVLKLAAGSGNSRTKLGEKIEESHTAVIPGKKPRS